jgi:hypothetical protein
LEDGHNQLLVQWAGAEVILCLAKDSRGGAAAVPSALFISRDYGDTFDNVTDKFRLPGGDNGTVVLASLDKFFNSPNHNGTVS